MSDRQRAVAFSLERKGWVRLRQDKQSVYYCRPDADFARRLGLKIPDLKGPKVKVTKAGKVRRC